MYAACIPWTHLHQIWNVLCVLHPAVLWSYGHFFFFFLNTINFGVVLFKDRTWHLTQNFNYCPGTLLFGFSMHNVVEMVFAPLLLMLAWNCKLYFNSRWELATYSRKAEEPSLSEETQICFATCKTFTRVFLMMKFGFYLNFTSPHFRDLLQHLS